MADLELRAIVLARLEDQISWYGAKATSNQSWYRVVSLLEIVIASSIVIVSSHTSPAAAVLGALIAVFKGMETTMQWQANWGNYRASREALTREKFLYLAGAGPYAGIPNADRLLAERIENIIASENTAWTSRIVQSRQLGNSVDS
jgi:hypothetical protein